MGWKRILHRDDVADGDVVGLQVAGQRVAVYRLGDEFFATEDVCTHQFALLSDGLVDGDCIECPLHFARFDIRSGKPTAPPARVALRVFPVRVDEAGDVLADVPDDSVPSMEQDVAACRA